MRFDDNRKLDTSRIDDQEDGRRGGGGLGGLGGGGSARAGLPIPGGMGGGIGGILLLLIMAFVGGGAGGCGPLSSSLSPTQDPANPAEVQLPGLPSGQSGDVNLGSSELDGIDLNKNPSGTLPGEGQVGEGDAATVCRTGADANRSQQCRFVAVENSLQEFWSTDLPRRGQDYQPARTNFFDGSVNTGCGEATEDVGPFYCPADSEIYLARGFFVDLESKFGAKGGPFAEAYVLAHEFGHHIQNVLGISEKAQRANDRQGADSVSVRVELQADCFAGVWARNATQGPDPLIVEITEADIREGLDAAAAVGDDNIQRRMTGQVNPHTFSHGTSEQRQRWFLNGFRNGELTDCDTFNANRL